MNERAHVDKLWAEAFFDGNIPWNAIGRKRFRKAVEATSRLGASYLPPTRHRLGGKLLQETYNRVVIGGEGGSVYENVVFAGGTMGRDGWIGSNGVPLINYCLSSGQKDGIMDVEICEEPTKKGAEFIRAGLERAFKKSVSEMMTKLSVSQHDAEMSIMQVLTDGAPNCAKARREFCKDKPWMFEAWCSLHCISLFFRDVFENVELFKSCSSRVKLIVMYLRNREKLN